MQPQDPSQPTQSTFNDGAQGSMPPQSVQQPAYPSVPTPDQQQPSSPAPNADSGFVGAAPQPNQPFAPVVNPITQPQPAGDPLARPQQPVSPMSQQPAYGQPFTPASTTPKAKRSMMPLIAVGVVVVLLAAAALVYVLVFSKQITAQDVRKAQDAVVSLSSDVEDVNTGLTEAGDADTADAAQAKLVTAQSKLADAQKQFAFLQKSPTLRDAKTKQKFQPVTAKWPAYATFLQNGISDSRSFLPVVIKFTSDSENFGKTPLDSVAAISAYLSQYKTLIDNTNTQLKSIKQTLSEDQQSLTVLRTFLSSSSASLATAQSDLASSGASFTVEDDLFKVDDARSTFTTGIEDTQSKLEDRNKKLDPSSELLDFQSALDTLQSKVK